MCQAAGRGTPEGSLLQRKEKTSNTQGRRRHDPAPANPFPILLLRWKHPRLHALEKDIRPQIKMVLPSECVA